MTIGNRIAYFRKKNELTQEILANKLGVSNQAVSKWEADQCCPDIQLLPLIADIFNVSIDSLFERTTTKKSVICSSLPWDNDNTLRVVAFVGQELQDMKPLDNATELKVVYDGDVHDVNSCVSVHCGNVNGDINAGTYVECGDVVGDINAGTYIECGAVKGDVNAGHHVICENIDGDATAGSHIECNNISGDANSQSHINCNNIDGDANASSHIECNNIGGDASSQSYINCNDIKGDAHCDGDITYMS